MNSSIAFWWVVQGASYSDERDRGILWAPLRNKNGHRKSHWDSMSRVRPGDVIVHYADVHVRAVSRVTHAAAPAPRTTASDAWDEEGSVIHTAYEELPRPLHRDAIPLELRLSQDHPNAPFFLRGQRAGNVNLGYLFDLTPDAGSAIVDLIERTSGLAKSTAATAPVSGQRITPSERVPAQVRSDAWRPPRYDSRVFHSRPITSDMAPDLERIVSYEEFRLQASFGHWLKSQGTSPRQLSLPTDGTFIQPDLYVPGRAWIVEAKKSTARPYVRLAIGQVLDYISVAELHGISAAPVLLLPHFPADDLMALLSKLGITVAAPSTDIEQFRVIEPVKASTP